MGWRNVRIVLVALGVSACTGGYLSVDSADGGPPPPDTTPPTTTDSGGPIDGGADAPADSADGAIPSYCAQLAPPAAPANFLCVDYDGPEIATGWNKAVTDGGVGSVISTTYASPPSSLEVPSGGQKQIAWSVSGVKPIQAIQLDVKLNIGGAAGVESWTGWIELARIKTSQVALTLVLLAGGSVDLQWSYEAPDGALTVGNIDLPSVLPNVFTKFTLKSVVTGGNQVAVLMNDVAVANTTFAQWTDTSASVTVGVNAVGMTGTRTVRFDDIVAKISRN